MKTRKTWLGPLGLLCMMLVALLAWAPAAKAAPDIDALLKKFDEQARAVKDADRIPGMVVAVWDGQKARTLCHGVRYLGKASPVNPDTLFQIGSATKSITAASLAQVIQGNKLGWTDKVAPLLPAFKMPQGWVTEQFEVIDLMTQRSGLPSHALMNPPQFGYTRCNIIEDIRYVRPVTSFRAEYAYQNCLFLVAAKLVEKYTDMSWDEAVTERLLRPLGMKRASLKHQSLIDDPNATGLHAVIDGKVEALPAEYAMMYWTDTYAPAGGLHASALEMLNWLRMFVDKGAFGGNQVLLPESVEALTRPRTVAKYADYRLGAYAQGWIYETRYAEPLIWHNGDTGANHAFIGFLPKSGVALVILTNLGQPPRLDALGHYFFDLYKGVENPDLPSDIPDPPAEEEDPAWQPGKPARPAKAYVGKYAGKVYQLEVRQKGEGLQAVVGPWHIEVDMLPLAGQDMFELRDARTGLELGGCMFGFDEKGPRKLTLMGGEPGDGPEVNELIRQ